MELSVLKSLVADGKIFGVKFIKRTDGSLRTMAARTGVVPASSPNNAERNWDPDTKGLLQVWDVHKRDYRMVPADGICELSFHGQRMALRPLPLPPEGRRRTKAGAR